MAGGPVRVVCQALEVIGEDAMDQRPPLGLELTQRVERLGAKQLGGNAGRRPVGGSQTGQISRDSLLLGVRKYDIADHTGESGFA